MFRRHLQDYVLFGRPDLLKLLLLFLFHVLLLLLILVLYGYTLDLHLSLVVLLQEEEALLAENRLTMVRLDWVLFSYLAH